jgi:4-aminobutyrate aminotransferase
MLGIEFVAPDGHTPEPSLADRALEETRSRGLLVGKGGIFGNCLRIAPPMTLTADEAIEGALILGEAVTAAVRSA